MYYFHIDESKYEEISLLWKEDISIISLYDLSENDFQKKLTAIGLSQTFIFELYNLLKNTIEAKSSNIIEFIYKKCKNLYNLITFTSSKQQNLKIDKDYKTENCGIYKDNLSNTLKHLIFFSLPLIQMYSKDNTLDPLSKSQLENNKVSQNLLIRILNGFKAEQSETFVHKKLIELTKDFKYGKNLKEFLSYAKNFYSSGLVAFAHLAFALHSLIENIESFIEVRDQLNKSKLQFSREFSKIYLDFEKHKNEMGILDLSKTEESNKKIKEIEEKIKDDKKKLKELIKALKEEIRQAKNKRERNGVGIAINCIGAISSIVGFVLTGGLLAGVYLGAAAINGLSIGITSAEVHEINKYLDHCEEILNCAMLKEKEINEFLDGIKRKI
jgi:hypothetical protein